jgi:hypothetical protein
MIYIIVYILKIISGKYYEWESYQERIYNDFQTYPRFQPWETYCYITLQILFVYPRLKRWAIFYKICGDFFFTGCFYSQTHAVLQIHQIPAGHSFDVGFTYCKSRIACLPREFSRIKFYPFIQC